ncbi:MAG TPA: MG2 domain-containing protein [Alphaproteobacteria bacterium]|nr:MG2 domain-containing protein [Alphaproteobacteria bacterium]
MGFARMVGRWGALFAAIVAPVSLAADPSPPLEIRSVSLAANRDVPELCLTFSEALGHRPSIPLQSYLAVEPAADIVAAAHDQRLCITGFAFSTAYTLTLKAGLPGTVHILPADWRTQFSVPGRPPELDFTPPGRIVPRLGPQSIELRSVNISRLRVELFHIADRDLVPLLDPSRPDGLHEPERRDPVWKGTIEVKSQPNREAATKLPIEKTIGALQPGVYEAVAAPSISATDNTVQGVASGYFVVSDLGLVAYRATDGMTVAVRSLASAAGAAGVDVALIGENNRELARVRTDGSGYARFDPTALKGTGGDRPRAIFAYGAAGEFSWLDLDAKESQTSALEAIVIPQRLDYRPGEKVSLTILLRDAQGRAPANLPATVELFRPNGALYDVKTSDGGNAGGYTATFQLPTGGNEGTWPIRVYAGAGTTPVGEAHIDVHHVQPARLTASASIESALMDPSQANTVDVRGQYSFGTPASFAPGEVDVGIGPAENPFPAFADFAFGLADEEAAAVNIDPVRFTTDAAGRASETVHIPAQPFLTRPTEAKIDGKILDVNGRDAASVAEALIANQPIYFGLKPRGEPDFTEGQPVHFDAIAVGPDGARMEKADAGWEIRRLERIPDWVWSGDRWHDREVEHASRVAGGVTSISTTSPASIESALPAGSYELEIFDPKSEAATSIRFHVGRPNGSVELMAPKPSFAPGEGVDVQIKPPFESDVLLATADRTLRSTAVQHIPAAGATMHVDIPRDADATLGLAATAIAPGSASASGLPRIANGLARIKIEPAGQQLGVKLDVPEKAEPEQPLLVSVAVSGAGDEPSYVAVSAVDANASLPPQSGKLNDFLFAKQTRQAALLEALGGGASQALPIDATPQSEMIVAPKSDGAPPSGPFALYSGVVALDKAGKAVVPLAAPSFTGKLRISATAWSNNRLGEASAVSTVQRPLAVTLELPSFLAPDDRLDLDLLLDNVDGPRGEYRVNVTTEGQVALIAGGEIVANLAEHEQRNQSISLQAHAPGAGAILVAVQGPGGIKFQRRFELPVRRDSPEVTRRAAITIKPEGQLTIDPSLLEGLRPDGTLLSITIDSATPTDPAAIARNLAASDFGPTEQRVSAATRLLTSSGAISVDAILAGQHADGGFGQWSEGQSSLWLSAYVMDFLGRAKAAGAVVPEGAYRLGLDYLSARADPVPGRDDAIDGPSQPVLEASAYANAVLARAGRIDLAALRYFADRFLPQLRSPLAMAWIASGFAALDDKSTAAMIVARALAVNDPPVAGDEFASELRDQAALAATIAEGGGDQSAALAKAAQKIGDLLAARRQLTPQEQAWLLRAARAVSTPENLVKLNVDGQSVQHRGPYTWSSPAGSAPHAPVIKNITGKPLRATIVVSGEPAPDQHEGAGYEMQRSFFDLQGKPTDPAALKQNDLAIVVLTGRFTAQGDPRPIVVAPLPAGWRLEATEIVDPAARYPWLKDLTGASHVSADAHQLVAVPEIAGDRHEFKFAFVVRAASRGQFALPPALIEDLSRPTLSAHSTGGKTKIDPPS